MPRSHNLLKLSSLVLFACFPVVSQEEMQASTSFTQTVTLGTLTARTLEEKGKLPQLSIEDSTQRNLLTVRFGEKEKTSFEFESILRLKTLSIRGLPDPLLLAVGVSPGGSDVVYEIAFMGDRKGKWQVLNPDHWMTLSEGGVYVGDLGHGYGVGAAVWNFVWTSGETHVDAHRYQIRLYRLSQDGLFHSWKRWISKKKYQSDKEALAERGLHYTNLLPSYSELKQSQ